MFEHIPFKELKNLSMNAYRVLKIGGELSVCVPNARFYIDAYLNKETFKNESEMFEPAIVKTGSWMDQINYIAYLNGLHHYMFDEENLINTLKLSPFKNVELRNFMIQILIKKKKERVDLCFSDQIKLIYQTNYQQVFLRNIKQNENISYWCCRIFIGFNFCNYLLLTGKSFRIFFKVLII